MTAHRRDIEMSDATELKDGWKNEWIVSEREGQADARSDQTLAEFNQSAVVDCDVSRRRREFHVYGYCQRCQTYFQHTAAATCWIHTVL